MTRDVLVVGAGPAGLVAAITLARYGANVLLAEKRMRISTLSRATVISTRSMEIFRSWGLEEAIRSGAADVEPCGWVTPTLASGEGEMIRLGYPTTDEAATVSPTRPAWAPQDHLEPLLLGLLRDSAPTDVRFGSELVGLEQHADRVVAFLRDRESGQTTWVETQYLVGADGAHSSVRAQLGIAMEGPDAIAEFQMVQFQALLAKRLGEHRYGLNIITHPDAPGVLVARGRNDRWGYAREWRPGQERLDDCPADRLAELIATAAGVADLQPRIERVSTFRFAAQLAERYRQQRCFLVGDAAHRMTPRGGTGMNTAIQDAHDLAWKLAWVLHGWAQPDLLDSYEAERRPVAHHNVTRSAEPDGAQRHADQALDWDLSGRLPHRWIRHGGRRVSTIDLLGHGLTLLVGPDGPAPIDGIPRPSANIPLARHTVDEGTARNLGINPGDTLLLGPDGRKRASSGHAEWAKPVATG